MANLIDLQDSYSSNDNSTNIEDDQETLKSLQTRLNNLSIKDREKLANAMGGEDMQDFPSA